MRGARHLFRDVFFLSLPLAAVLVYLVFAAATSFVNAEVLNFHGYPARGLRIGSLRRMLRYTLDGFLQPAQRRYLSDALQAEPSVRVFDLRIDGTELDALEANLPGSGRVWRAATLGESDGLRDVEVRVRGQRMDNYFFERKSWKIKTDKDLLVDGDRILNLTPACGRLDNHLAFLLARRLGLPAPESRVVWVFVNREDYGLYLQEQQIDELLIRRNRRMPGDIFYGELFIPDEPKRGSDDLFSNPFLWEKKARFNRYPDEYRPYLAELLDHVASSAPGSWNALFRLLDQEVFTGHFALLAFQGDQHIDHSHNHKLYFNPLTGRFEPLVWNARLSMPRGRGVESMANRLFRKVCQDPRFLDAVHRRIEEDLIEADATSLQLAELERLRELAPLALPLDEFDDYLNDLGDVVRERGKTVLRWHRQADLRYQQRATAGARVLTLWARAAASFGLTRLTLESPCPSVRLYEDRDQSGALSEGDRELALEIRGRQLQVTDEDALLYTGRDFRAPYHDAAPKGQDTFSVHRQYTRLAYLESTLLLVSGSAAEVPEVVEIAVRKTVGPGGVKVGEGPPEDYRSEETIHPWSLPPASGPREVHWAGEVHLTEDLLLGREDLLTAEPGTRLLLGPGVSVRIASRVALQGLRVRPLVAGQPWGVFALQGPAASGSVLVDCDLEGGSEDTLEHVYYSGMLSVHHADRVVIRGGRYAANLLGDDTLRFARCDDLRLEDFLVVEANGDAIDCDLSTGILQGVQIIEPHNDGVDLMTANVHLREVVVQGAGDKGLSLGESANPEVRDCQFVGCATGVAIKDGSDPLLVRCRIEGCQVAIDSFDKNWRYPGGGRGRLQDCTLRGNQRDVRLRGDSVLTLERCTSEGRFDLPEGESERLILAPPAQEDVP